MSKEKKPQEKQKQAIKIEPVDTTIEIGTIKSSHTQGVLITSAEKIPNEAFPLITRAILEIEHNAKPIDLLVHELHKKTGLRTESIHGFIEQVYPTVVEAFKQGELTGRKKGKKGEGYRQGAHLAEQMGRSDSQQATLFGQDKELDNFMIYGNDIQNSEYKLIEVLSQLVYTESINKDTPEDEETYMAGSPRDLYGNKLAPIKAVNKNYTTAPQIHVTLYSVAQKFTQKTNPSGKDIENVKDIVERLTETRFGIQYEYEFSRGKGSTVRRIVETQTPLISQARYTDIEIDDETGEGTVIAQGLALVLHPIFTHQIHNKFVQKPGNWLQIQNELWGGRRAPNFFRRLGEYLLRVSVDNNRQHKVREAVLLENICLEDLRQRKRKRAVEHLNQALELWREGGLIKSLETTKAKTDGSKMFVITLQREKFLAS